MSALKNLAILKRNISRRIRQALQELQETLGNERSPVPVRVPVPVRGGVSRSVHTAARAGMFGGAGAGFNVQSAYARFPQVRAYSTYSSRFSGFHNWRWNRINQSILFQNFSSRASFRLRLFSSFYRAPSVTEMLRKRSGYTLAVELRRTATYAVPMAEVPLTLRLNLLLTQHFHDMVMDLARPAAACGCYVDFKLQPKIMIPQATMMSGEVLGELLANLKHFERHISELQRDLTRLSELGELPLKVIGAENVIRVYFPNCDRDQLEVLLQEKNVVGGVIHEDYALDAAALERDESVSSVSDFDVLSSCSLLSLVSSGSEYEDILSSSCSDSHVVHLEPLVTLDHVEIAGEDDYCWA